MMWLWRWLIRPGYEHDVAKAAAVLYRQRQEREAARRIRDAVNRQLAARYFEEQERGDS